MISGVPRPSPVTDVVKRLFEGDARHAWSLDELHDAARVALGGADYSTVFRAVSAMEREGAIHRIDLGDGKAHYEVGDEHHEHVRCDSCGIYFGTTGGQVYASPDGGENWSAIVRDLPSVVSVEVQTLS